MKLVRDLSETPDEKLQRSFTRVSEEVARASARFSFMTSHTQRRRLIKKVRVVCIYVYSHMLCLFHPLSLLYYK
jgi:hypothetical protein